MTRNEMMDQIVNIRAAMVRKLAEAGYHAGVDVLRACQLRIDGRMTKMAGQCRYYYHTGGPHVVRINPNFFVHRENEGNFRNTVVHELCHVLAPFLQHGEGWRRLMRVFGEEPREFHNMTKGARLGKNERLWQCVKCRGVVVSTSCADKLRLSIAKLCVRCMRPRRPV